MPSAESQVNYEDFVVDENEIENEENQIHDMEDDDDTDDDSRFDAPGCVSLIYKVEMEDKKEKHCRILSTVYQDLDCDLPKFLDTLPILFTIFDIFD